MIIILCENFVMSLVGNLFCNIFVQVQMDNMNHWYEDFKTNIDEDGDGEYNCG